MSWAIPRLRRALLVAAATLTMIAPAVAHPHVLPTVSAAIVFNTEGGVAAIRYLWTYDVAYSTFVRRDIDADRNGMISEAALAAFARNQVNALAESNYFSTLKVEDGKLEFEAAASYGASFTDDGRLRLKFTLPLKTAAKPHRPVVLEIYDPNFFAYFTVANNDVQLDGAGEGCSTIVTGPKPIDLTNTRSVPALFWQALDGSKTAGLNFVNRVAVSCP